MNADTVSTITDLVSALPAGPLATFESPFPALEQIAGRDVNLGSTFGEINLPFGKDFLDITKTEDRSINVSDILDISAGNGVKADGN